MGSLMSKITVGVKNDPQMYVIYGAPGVGKTTFASKFPNPIIADIENGSSHVNVTRVTGEHIKTFQDLRILVEELKEQNYKTLVIDSITKLEAMIHKHLCEEGNVSSIEAVDGGFGKGFTMAREVLADFIQKLRTLMDQKQMDVVFIGHTRVKGHNDPHLNVQYDRYGIQAHDKFVEMLMSAANNVFYVRYDVDTSTDSKTKKTKATYDGKRVMFTEWRAAFEAKNRLNLPAEMPFIYDAFHDALMAGKPKSAEELKADIAALLDRADQQTVEIAKVKVAEAGDDAAALTRIKIKLTEMVRPQMSKGA